MLGTIMDRAKCPREGGVGWIGSNARGREVLGTTMDRVKCPREGDVGYYYG